MQTIVDRRVRPAWRDRRSEQPASFGAEHGYLQRSPGRRASDLASHLSVSGPETSVA